MFQLKAQGRTLELYQPSVSNEILQPSLNSRHCTHPKVPRAGRHQGNVVLRHVGHGDDIRLAVKSRREAGPTGAHCEGKSSSEHIIVGIGDALLVGGSRGGGGDQGQGSAGRAYVSHAWLGHASTDGGGGGGGRRGRGLGRRRRRGRRLGRRGRGRGRGGGRWGWRRRGR